MALEVCSRLVAFLPALRRDAPRFGLMPASRGIGVSRLSNGHNELHGAGTSPSSVSSPTKGCNMGKIASGTLLLLIVGVGGCGSPSPSCRQVGGYCTATTDCCGSMVVCSSGVCTTVLANGCSPDAPVACTGALAGNCCYTAQPYCCKDGTNCAASASDCPGACATAGQACGATPCCAGLNCTGGKCVAPGMCVAMGAFCSSTSQCCVNLSCRRYSPKCAIGDIGDPCRTNGDCTNGLTCNGSWCTRTCARASDCSTSLDAPAGVNECVALQAGGFGCFPFCRVGTSDCAPFIGTTCKSATGAGGGTFTVCSS